METIVAVAIRVPVADEFREKMWNEERVYPDYLYITAPPPARHHTLMHPTYDAYGLTKPQDSGFLTSKGRYVGREEALKIALASGQPMIDHPARHPTQLFSEDLW